MEGLQFVLMVQRQERLLVDEGEIRKVAKVGSLQALTVVQKALAMALAAGGVAHSIPKTRQPKTVRREVRVLWL
jgi:hypothetical protein